VDLLDFFRGVRPWGQFYRLVKGLPADGKFKAAQANDPELARALLDSPADGKQGFPTLEGYDLQTRIAIAQFNMLKILDWHLLRVNGNKVPQPQMWELPQTAVEREQSYRRKLQIDRALALLGVE
jgi:hypothetical protein